MGVSVRTLWHAVDLTLPEKRAPAAGHPERMREESVHDVRRDCAKGSRMVVDQSAHARGNQVCVDRHVNGVVRLNRRPGVGVPQESVSAEVREAELDLARPRNRQKSTQF